jgi:hypothetical protein
MVDHIRSLASQDDVVNNMDFLGKCSMFLFLLFNLNSLDAMDLYLENHLGLCPTSSCFSISQGWTISSVWGGTPSPLHSITFPHHPCSIPLQHPNMRRSTSCPIVAPQEPTIEGLVVATQEPTVRTIKGLVVATQEPTIRVKEGIVVAPQEPTTKQDKPKTLLKRRTCQLFFF